MTDSDFIEFLAKRCREQMTFNPAFFEREHGRDEAYNDILLLIKLHKKGDTYGKNAAA